MTKMPITHWQSLNDYEVNQLQQVLLNEFAQLDLPREWTSAYGDTVIGYQIGEGEEERYVPIYANQAQAQQIDVREVTRYGQSSDGATSSRTKSTDQSWWD